MPNIFTGFSNNLPCQRVVDYFKLLHLLLFFLMESGYITSKSETESCSVVSDSLRPHGLYSPWDSLGQNTGLGSLSLLQGIFPNQGLNPSLPHCRWILYQLSHKGSPRILEWVAYPFSSRSPLTQELNWGLLHCRWIPYQLSYQGSAWTLRGVAKPVQRVST